MALIRLVAALFAVYLPAALLMRRFAAGQPPIERAIQAATLGLASLIFLSVLLSYVDLYLVFVAWAIALAAALWLRRGAPSAPHAERTDWYLIAILSLVAISRIVVALPHELPPGWDPTFHLVLARKIVDARGMIHDWTPFENVALNYPLGSHMIVAILSIATGLPLHRVFNFLIPLLGVVTTAQIYLLAKRATQSAEVARYSAAAYGFWANWGSIDYYRWGGLPNLVGMSLLIGALTSLLSPAFRRAERLTFGLVVASIFLTHHHVMLTAGCIFAALFLYDVVTRNRDRGYALLSGLGIAFLLGSFFIIPYALKAQSIGATNAMTLTELPMLVERLATSVGMVLLLFASAGIAIAAVNRPTLRPSAEIGVMAAVLIVLFIAFQYVYYWLSAKWPGGPYVAFTPSRFFTDLAYPLSIYAGFAVDRIRVLLRVHRAPAAVAVLLLGLPQISVWRHLYSIPTLPEPLWQAYTWIQQHTDHDAIVLDGGRWSVYGTWRRTVTTSLPASEPSTYGTPKARLIEALQAGTRPPEAATTQVVAIRSGSEVTDRDRILWHHASDLAVVELWPGSGGRR